MNNNLYSRLTQWWFKDTTLSALSNDLSWSYQVKYSGKVSNADHLPMLIALHGDGGTVGSFYETALDIFKVPARIILITAPISHEMGNVWPYSSDQFVEYGEAFSKVVDSLAIQYPTVNKPILLGYSGGGTMAYYQAVKHGDSYSYIFPISGLLFKEQLSGRSSKPSAEVYAYHGINDEVVSFSAGKTAIKLLKKKGVTVSFTEFEGAHNGFFREMKAEITLAIENKLISL